MTSHWIACLIVIITEIKPIILIWFCVILANLFGSAISFSSFMLLKIEDGQGELIIFLDTYRKFILCTQYFEWGCEMPLSKFGILSVSPVELCIHLSLFCPSLEWGHKSRHREGQRERKCESDNECLKRWSKLSVIMGWPQEPPYELHVPQFPLAGLSTTARERWLNQIS